MGIRGMTSLSRGAITLTLLAAASLAGWLAGPRGWTAMPMGSMPATAGAAGLLFMGSWLAMLLAMMLPSFAPMAVAYQRVAAAAGAGWWRVPAFVLGYLLVWSAAGLLPLLLGGTLPDLEARLGPGGWARVLAAALALAGLYQISPWKAACLRSCRAPLAFLVRHHGGPLRLGALHGMICLGCCWALMALMVVAGAMSPIWMAGLAVLFLGEKAWRHGLVLSRLAGAATALAAVLILLASGG